MTAFPLCGSLPAQRATIARGRRQAGRQFRCKSSVALTAVTAVPHCLYRVAAWVGWTCTGLMPSAGQPTCCGRLPWPWLPYAMEATWQQGMGEQVFSLGCGGVGPQRGTLLVFGVCALLPESFDSACAPRVCLISSVGRMISESLQSSAAAAPS